MGVHGLWQLLHPAGRPVSLESLEGKVLAVDVSIWLHQTMKGMRDKDGNPLPNAHLQGLFSRVCKLLFYRIKPVFVFDGGVPVLKKQTLAARRDRKIEAERESSDIASKLMQNLIKSQAVKQALGNSDSPPKRVPGVRRGRNKEENDMFELTPLPESEEIRLTMNAEEWDRDFEIQENWIKEGLAALSDTHPDSEEFKSLPMELQHEVLSELKEQRKYHSLSRITKMPEKSEDFSSYQLKKLMKQSKLTTRIEEVRKEMSSKTAGDITYSMGDDYYGDDVEARRIVSEDASHYVLIKGLTKKKQEEEALKYEVQQLVKLEKMEKGDDAYGGSYFRETQQHDVSQTKPKKQQGKIVSSDSDSDVDEIISRRMRRRRAHKQISFRKGKKSKDGGKTMGKTSKKTKIISSDEEDVELKDGEKPAEAVSHSSSEDEGFIEVTVDPSLPVEEDELFPASVFAPSTETTETTIPRQKPVAKETENTSIASKNIVSASANNAVSSGQAIISSDKDAKIDEVKFNASDAGKSDAAAKRKSVLNDILSQLQEKKRNLDETVVEVEPKVTNDIHEDFSKSGGFIREDSADGEQDVTHVLTRDDISSKSVSTSENKEIIHVSEETGADNVDSLSDSDEDLKLAIELSLQIAKDEGNISAKKALSSVSTLDTDGNSAGLKKASSTLPKDDIIDKTDLTFKVANTISSHDPPSQMSECVQSVDSESEDDEQNSLEEVAPVVLPTEANTNLSEKMKDSVQKSTVVMQDTEIRGILPTQRLDQPTNIPDEDLFDQHMDTDSQVSEDAAINSHTKTHTTQKDDSHTPNLPGHQAVEEAVENVSPTKLVQDRLQPEDFEIDDEADAYFRTLNEDDLMDINMELNNERSALLSERGRQTRMATSVTEQINLEAQELLKLFGIPFIISPMEAEAQCAYLDNTEQTQGTITDDSDIWLFGGGKVYKNFFNQNKLVEFISYDNIRNHFGLDRSQLINIALLCGSDYTEGIQGVGPVKALEIMAEFPGEGLEGLYMFRQWWDKAKKKAGKAPENKIRARLKDLSVIPGFPSEAVVDAYLNPTVDDSSESFSWGTPDLDMLRDFAKFKFGWPKDKTDQTLLPMMKQLNKKQSQGRIHSYFQPENFVQTSKIKSDRLRKALALVKGASQGTGQKDETDRNEEDYSNGEEEMDTEDALLRRTQKRKAVESEDDKKQTTAKTVKKSKPQLKDDTEQAAEVSNAKKKNSKTKDVEKSGNFSKASKKKKRTETLTKSEKKLQSPRKKKPLKSKEAKDSIANQSMEAVAQEMHEEMEPEDKELRTAEQDGGVSCDTIVKDEKTIDDHFVQIMTEKVKQAHSKLEMVRGRGRGVRGGGVGRETGKAGGRGHALISLDQKRKSHKGRGSKISRGTSQRSRGGRGAINLSESSSNDDDDSDDSSNLQKSNASGVKKSQLSANLARELVESKKKQLVNIVHARKVSTEHKTIEKDNTDSRLSTTVTKDVKGKMVTDRTLNSQEGGTFASSLSTSKASNGTKTKAKPVSSGNNSVDRGATKDREVTSSASSRNEEAIGTTLLTSQQKKACGKTATGQKNRSTQKDTDQVKVSPTQEVPQRENDKSEETVIPEEEEKVDIRKADVSIINKQNLPFTLTYLNQRSREDKFLLHQLKGSKVMNAVEQRLAESEKKSRIEKTVKAQKEKEIETQNSGEILSFEDMLGGMDAAVIESSQKKSKSGQSGKAKQDVRSGSTNMTDKLDKVKSLQAKIAKQLVNTGTTYLGASKGKASKSSRQNPASLSEKFVGEIDKVPTQQKFSEDFEGKKKGLKSKAEKITKDKKIKERKIGFGSSDESSDLSELTPPTRQISKHSVEEAVSLKTNRSLQFDVPIGEDDDQNFGVKQSKKKNRFQKQLDHLHDSRSVKGYGTLPRQAVRGRAFAGKGKGIGKNRNKGEGEMGSHPGKGVSTDIQASGQVNESDIKEYEQITAEDLGSDFSDFEM